MKQKRQKKPIKYRKLEEITIPHDWQYEGASVDYKIVNDCEAYGCDYICRCGVIEDQTVNIKYNSILLNLHVHKLSPIDAYCLDRICAISGLFEPASFDIRVVRGYYGEVVESVLFIHRSILQGYLNDLCNIEDTDLRIEYILKAEYKYIASELTNLTYRVDYVPRELVRLNAKEYLTRLNQNKIKLYTDVTVQIPKGICTVVGRNFHVWDGYHRITATNDCTIPVIIGYKKEL